MTLNRRWDKEVDQIERIADAKGVELDDIEVIETETDDGDEMVLFRAYETKAETEEDSVGIQVSKIPSVQTGEMTFRNDVQSKISALKRHITGQQQEELQEVEEEFDGESDSTSSSSRTRDRNRSRPEPSGDGPGAQLDAEIEAIHDRLDEFEERLEELEDKSEALDGLKQLMED